MWCYLISSISYREWYNAISIWGRSGGERSRVINTKPPSAILPSASVCSGICLCVCACVHACVRDCACVCVCTHACVCMCVCVSSQPVLPVQSVSPAAQVRGPFLHHASSVWEHRNQATFQLLSNTDVPHRKHVWVNFDNSMLRRYMLIW